MVVMKRKILIVEDNQSVRENIAEILDTENYETFQAENGAIAIDFARKVQPDLVICDIMMPEIDGYEVLKIMRQTPSTSTVPIIFLTAKTTKEDVRKGMEIGADDYITKPFTIEELLKAVNIRLEKSDNQKKIFDEKVENIAHNISNPIKNKINEPLKAIISFSEMILSQHESMDKTQIIEFVSLIYNNSLTLTQLVRKTMLYYQLQTLKIDEKEFAVLKSQVTSQVKSIIEDTANKIAGNFNRSEDLSLKVEDAVIPVPSNFFKDIVSELIENAFVYSQKKTRVKIMSDIEKNRYVFSIIDEGTGMSDRQIQSIDSEVPFDLNIGKNSGMGLGLHNVKKILQLFLGEITISSKEGLGTMIKVSLPLNQ
jgi:two-component system, sensor histidine kinase and response regulator